MSKTISILFTILLLFTIESCMDNENTIKYTDVIQMEAGPVPDTMIANETYSIQFRMGVPNSCWHSLTLTQEEFNDSTYRFWATAIYENHGENCAQVLVTKDTVIAFKPTVAKPHILVFFNDPSTAPRVDTVVVMPN